LQLWWVEGRDFRSPNQMPDGPQKSIWGAEQKAWLKRSLLESDATFKILISPTPMIGPDDASKNDNHANAGFRHEGDAFFAWMKENGISPARFFIVCGDRHWKYHSRNAQGYQEFSCGALNIENARLGRAPGSKDSSDPQGRIVQSYTDAKPTGGFLHIRLTSGEGNPTQLHFRHCDDSGKELYQQGFSDKR